MTRKIAELDYEFLAGKVNGRKTYKLADVKDRIEKVAFDTVRFKDADNLDKLWVIDGDVIVATYDEDDDKIEVKSDWNALPNHTASHINVFYKSEPIHQISLATLGVPTEDASTVCRSLKIKLASDDSMRKSLLSELADEARELVLQKYPELK